MHASTSSFNIVLFSLSGCLVDFGARTAPQVLLRTDAETVLKHSEPTPDALNVLQQLQQQSVPCAWLDTLAEPTCMELARQLPAALPGFALANTRPLPAPDIIWQALIALDVDSLQGCVLVSGDPLLLQAALNAGLWTVGLAISGPLCGRSLESWQSLPTAECTTLRNNATLALYRLGVHSVIDQLSDLPACLEDISRRQFNGDKP